MGKITNVEGLRDVVGKKVRIVFSEKQLDDIEGVLLKGGKFVDLEGEELETSCPYVVVYNKYYHGGCTWCDVDDCYIGDFIEGIEVIEEYAEDKEKKYKELIEKIKQKVNQNYDSEKCGATSEWSHGNSDDVFNDGEEYGRSWLAYEIGCILGMELEKPVEPKYSWEE